MTQRNDGGPAFPREMKTVSFETEGGVGTAMDEGHEGMALRDWFAGQATWPEIEHILRHEMQLRTAQKFTAAEIALARGIFADTMLKEREK